LHLKHCGIIPRRLCELGNQMTISMIFYDTDIGLMAEVSAEHG
jgi:hypothetical protein